jgi:hypothetical protein
LTDEETLWLAAFNRMEKAVGDSLNNAPATLTQSSELAEAAGLRVCSSTLTSINVPSPRLQPVYQPAQQECAAFDKAATCLETLAAMGDNPKIAPGSDAERKFSQATDCFAAGMNDGGVAMSSAMQKSSDIRTASGDM